jgi:hypothetical protein
MAADRAVGHNRERDGGQEHADEQKLHGNEQPQDAKYRLHRPKK